MSNRLEFSKKTKLQAFERSKGLCQECGKKLYPGDIQYDHALAAGLGGDNSLENCVVLCVSCHKAKTGSKDVPAIAKANRVRAKHLGAHETHHKLPCGRKSNIKKRLDGTVVYRDTGLPVR